VCCGIKDFRDDPVLGPVLEHYGPRNWSNGDLVYAPDFSKPADVADIQVTGATAKDGKLVSTGNGMAIFRLPLPYPFICARLETTFEGGGGKVSVSTDAGKTWQAAATGDLTNLVKQQYDVWLKVEFPTTLAKFALMALVEHNRSALPYLVPGKNKVTVSVASKEVPKDQVLTVTFLYQEVTAAKRRQRFDGEGLTMGEVQRVTKEITSVPFTFDINVGGNTPPKMISLERSVRAK
jgi:hypothetical protein